MILKMLTPVFVLIILLAVVPINAEELQCKQRLDVISQSAWPALSTLYLGRNLQNVVKLAAVGYLSDLSATHAVLYTTEHKTYLRGNSHYFHLYGRDMTRELVELRGRKVMDIRFGHGFIAILTADGIVWTAGENDNGQLGHHRHQNRPVFSPVEKLPPVKQLAVGTCHIVVLTHDRKLYSWGCNSYKELGYSASSNPTPRIIPIPPGTSVPKYVCCGYRQCTVFMENLSILTWGFSLNIGRPSSSHSLSQVQRIPTNYTIQKVTCGYGHTLALSTNGTLFAWGWLYHGAGLNATNVAPYASKLNLGTRIVRDMVTGWHSTVIRTYSSVAEYFGRYNGRDFPYPRLAHRFRHPRDIMANSTHGQNTYGAVFVRCPQE